MGRSQRVNRRITIIGGGIAGLSTAYYIERLSEEKNIPVEITLIDADTQLGGKVRSIREQGFLMEDGPDSMFVEKPAALELCKEIGLEEELIPLQEEHRNFYIYHKNRLVRFPPFPQNFMSVMQSSLLSPFGKIRAIAEPLIPPRKSSGDESIAQFLSRRFGDEYMRNIAGPVLAGIYAGDPGRISIQATFPRFAMLEREAGSLVRGMSKSKVRKTGETRSASFYSLRNGMQQFIEELRGRVNASILTGTRVKNLHMHGPKYELQVEQNGEENKLEADIVILATPGNHSATILEDNYPEIAYKLRKIRFGSSASISLGYYRKDAFQVKPLTGSGFMVAMGQNVRITGCTWASNKFEGRSAEPYFLLRAFVSNNSAPGWTEWTDEQLMKTVRDELQKILGIEASPVVTRIRRWLDANPMYEVGHRRRASEVEAEIRKIPGLYVTGSSYHGVSLSDCVSHAQLTAEDVFRIL